MNQTYVDKFPAAVAVWTQLNGPYNCPFIHIVYLPCTYHKVLLNHYAAFCLDKFWAKGTSSHKCHIPITDSIVLLKQRWSKVKWEQNQQKYWLFHSIIIHHWWNPTHGNTQWKSKIEDPSEKRAYFTHTGEYHFLDTWRIRVRKRHNPRKILCSTQNPGEHSMQKSENFVEGAVINYKVIFHIAWDCKLWLITPYH